MMQRMTAIALVGLAGTACFAQSGTVRGFQWERLALAGEATPTGDTWTGFGVPAINGGKTAWWGVGDAGEGSGTRLVLHDNSGTQQIAGEGEVGIIGTGLPVSFDDLARSSPSVLADGSVLYGATNGIYSWSAGTNTLLASEAQIETAIVDEGSSWGAPVLANGRVVFPAGSQRFSRRGSKEYGSVLSVDPAVPGVVDRIASDQSIVPGLTGLDMEFVDRQSPANTSAAHRLASDGERLIMRITHPDLDAYQEGIYIQNGDGSFDLVADTSTPAGFGAGNFAEFSGYVALTEDAAYFTGREAGGEWGIYASTAGSIEKIFDTSMVSWDLNGDTLDYIGQMSVVNDIVVFQASWNGGDDGAGEPWDGGVFAIIDGQVETVVSSLDSIDGMVFESAHLTADSFDGEYLAIKAYLREQGSTDIPTGIYRFRIPSPGAVAVFGMAGVVSLRRRRS